MRESDIQYAILANLRYRNVLAFRCQPAPIPIRKGKAIIGFRKSDAFNVGMPDIVCVINGMFIGIEVKSPEGRQRDEQKLWQRRIESAGGMYLLARSWEEVEKALNI